MDDSKITRISRLDEMLDTLDRLLGEGCAGTHLSLYVNAGRFPGEGPRARETFRRLLEEASARAGQDDAAGRDDGAIWKGCRTLLDDDSLWSHEEGGVAVLANRAGIHVLLTGCRLPNKWALSSDYHLKPLLAAAARADAYWLLTLSGRAARLFRGSRLGFREAACRGLPRSFLGAIVPQDEEAESGGAAGEEELREFLKEIEETVHERLRGSELPLLVAGRAREARIYRELNQYPHLSERALETDVENLRETELQAKASETLRDDFRESEARQLLRYKEAAERGTALDRLDLILAAAQQGQIEVLFVPYDEDCPGTFDPADVTVDRDTATGMHNPDLYELAARLTLETGGEVFFTEAAAVPAKRKCIALLRWTGDAAGLEEE